MTRFKELKRIEAAIEHKDQVELQWAIGYCKMRFAITGGFAQKANLTTDDTDLQT